MHLKLFVPPARGHTDIAVGVGWSAAGELFSCSDDRSVCRWSSSGGLEGKVRGEGLALDGAGAGAPRAAGGAAPGHAPAGPSEPPGSRERALADRPPA
jgi:hypothetical protein